MCGPFTGMMSSIGTIVTLSKNVFLLVLRYTPSYDPVRTFFIKVWIIPRVVPQIHEEFLPLLKCKTWRQKLCNDKISIIYKPRVGMRFYFYNSKLFIWKLSLTGIGSCGISSILERLSATGLSSPFLLTICKSNS